MDRGGFDVVVLFDGAGLARLGLERAGLRCVGIELNPVAHYLGRFVGSGQTFRGDVRDFDYSGFPAIWASPPCQEHSAARTQGDAKGEYADGSLLAWSLSLPSPTLWVENVLPQGKPPMWGKAYNAAQFEEDPRQQRNRVIGGRFPEPDVIHAYKKTWPGVCPTITATEFKGCATDTRRASRFYGRKFTIEECAYRMGFDIPAEWYDIPDWFEPDAKAKNRMSRWTRELYRAIGNGVPVYMAKAFGESYVRTIGARDAA
jgi:site-specific DNA-cytosine methylase